MTLDSPTVRSEEGGVSYERGTPAHGYLGYKKPELKKPYRICPPRFLDLRKRGPTEVGAPVFIAEIPL